MNSPSKPYQSAERHVRTCRFTPYIKRADLLSFTLIVWDTYERRDYGKFRLAYQLRMHLGGETSVLFDGADFCTPEAIDSDSTIESLMGFLTLRPGDTDEGYFEGYTEAQREFCSQHAETLSCEVQSRFCDENGRVIRA